MTTYYPLGQHDDLTMSEGEYQRMYYVDVENPNGPDCEPLEPEDPPPGFWRTKDGRVIAIAEMTDDHLANTIAMFKRRKSRWRHWYGKLAELKADSARRQRERAATRRALGLR